MNQAQRTIVVTGAGSGIGRACCLRLAEPGSHVVAIDRNGEAAADVAARIDATDATSRAVECDVTRPEDVEAAFEPLSDVDVLVNSAGLDEEKALEDITADDMARLYEVNAVGLFGVSRAAIARCPTAEGS